MMSIANKGMEAVLLISHRDLRACLSNLKLTKPRRGGERIKKYIGIGTKSREFESENDLLQDAESVSVN
jgi:hypothetical protein